MHGGAGHKLTVAVKTIELRRALQGQGDGLEQQHGGQDARGDGLPFVVLLQPGQRGCHWNGLGQVVMWNLALGAAHGGGNGAAHVLLAIGGTGWRHARRHRGGLRRCLDVGQRYRAFGTGALHRVRVDAQLFGPAAGRR